MLQPDLAHTEVLDRFALTSLHEVRRVTKDWHRRYNHHDPSRTQRLPACWLRRGVINSSNFWVTWKN